MPFEWTLSDLRDLGALDGSYRPPSQFRTTKYLISKGFEDAIDEGAGAGAGFNTVGKLNVPCPFSVEPWSGDIEAGGEQTFAVRFAPQEVKQFLLLSPLCVVSLVASPAFFFGGGRRRLIFRECQRG